MNTLFNTFGLIAVVGSILVAGQSLNTLNDTMTKINQPHTQAVHSIVLAKK